MSIRISCFHAKSAPKGAHFFIQAKGLHAGRPLRNAIPNAFLVEVSSAEELENWYWLTFMLYTSKQFQPHIGGSVIPFIRIKDVKTLLMRNPARPAEIAKIAASLKEVEKLEKIFEFKLKTIRDLKVVLAHKAINS